MVFQEELTEKKDMFHLALMILHNQCPPNNKMYLCTMGEELECDCTLCWSNYLFWATNGHMDDPYKYWRKNGSLSGI